jgi:hypothetical protein
MGSPIVFIIHKPQLPDAAQDFWCGQAPEDPCRACRWVSFRTKPYDPECCNAVKDAKASGDSLTWARIRHVCEKSHKRNYRYVVSLRGGEYSRESSGVQMITCGALKKKFQKKKLVLLLLAFIKI